MEVAHLSHAAGAVGVQVHREVDLLFYGPDEVIGILGGDQAAHIFDANGVAAKLCQLDGELGKLLIAVHGADGVAYSGLDMLVHLLGSLDRSLHISYIIDRIENPENIDPVLGCSLHKSVH